MGGIMSVSHIALRITLAAILSLGTLAPVIPAVAAGSSPKLVVNCGSLMPNYDFSGNRYLLFSPTVKVRFYGKKLNYWVYYAEDVKTKLKDQSKTIGTLKFGDGLMLPRNTYLNLDYKWYFRVGSKYHKTTIKVKDSVTPAFGKAKSAKHCLISMLPLCESALLAGGLDVHHTLRW
jgi:hypothetical protein